MTSKANATGDTSAPLMFLIPFLSEPVKEKVLRLVLLMRETVVSNPALQSIAWLQGYLPKAFKEYNWSLLLKSDIETRVKQLHERLSLHLLPGSPLMQTREQYYQQVQACQRKYEDPNEFARVDFQRSRCKKNYKAVLKKIEKEARDQFNKIYPNALTEYDLLFDDTKANIVISSESLEKIVLSNITAALLKHTTLSKEDLHAYLWIDKKADRAINEELPAEPQKLLEKHFFEHYINPAKNAVLEQPEHPLYARIKLFADIQTLQNHLTTLHKIAFDILSKVGELKGEKKTSPRLIKMHIPRKSSIDVTSLTRLNVLATQINTTELREVTVFECEDASKRKQTLSLDFMALQQVSQENITALLDLAPKYRDLCKLSKEFIQAVMKSIPPEDHFDQQSILLSLQIFQTQLIALDTIISTTKQ